MEMVKESVRKCSHCGNNGHNSRTCSAGGKGCLKLFGVQILTEKEDEAMRKSLSMGNLQSCNIEHHHGDAGYLSDGLLQSRRGKRAHERKKGIHHSLSLLSKAYVYDGLQIDLNEFNCFLIVLSHAIYSYLIGSVFFVCC